MSEETTSTALTQFQEQLEREAKEIQSRIASIGGDRIKLNKRNQYIFPDGTEGPEFDGIVVDFISANMFYDRAYNPDEAVPPACFALGPNPRELTPSVNSPVRQSDTNCAVCPNNQFGTAPNGKGKACKNARLLAIIPLESLIEGTPELVTFSVPPTSVSTFDKYVANTAARLRTSPTAVVTTFSADQNAEYQTPKFSANRPLTAQELAEVFKFRDQARERLMTEPDVSKYEPPPVRAPRSMGGGAGRGPLTRGG